MATSVFLDGYSDAVHFDGDLWTTEGWLPSHLSSDIQDIACGADGPWSIGTNDLLEEPPVARWERGSWVLVPLEDPAGDASMAALSAGPDGVWIAGEDRFDGDDDSYAAQIWHLTDGGFAATVSEEIRFVTTDYRPVLRAVGQLASGRVLALGVDGLVLERAADPSP